MSQKGKLIGVGVGPGDPELMTIKAVRTVRAVRTIAVVGNKEKALGYKICRSQVEDLDTKFCLELDMPMTNDIDAMMRAVRQSADLVVKVLEAGDDVAFLTLGDPSLYCSYTYLQKFVSEMGYETAMISGVPSFCAAASLMNEELVSGTDELHVIPMTSGTDDYLDYSGTKILMKASIGYDKTVARLKEIDDQVKISMVVNAGMENEQVYHRPEEFPEKVGYFATIIIGGRK